MPRPISPELDAKIDRILLEEWDPIGVYGLAPDDEYRAHLPKVAQLVASHDRTEEVADYLEWARVENMGLGPNREKDLQIARRRIALVA